MPETQFKEAVTEPIKHDIKERLKNPFFSAYIFSFIVWNWKAFYIGLFSGDIGVISKINLIKAELNSWGSYILVPLIAAFLRVWFAPYIKGWIEKYETRRKIELENEKNNILYDNEILSIEGVQKLKAENSKLAKELEELKGDIHATQANKIIELNNTIEAMESSNPVETIRDLIIQRNVEIIYKEEKEVELKNLVIDYNILNNNLNNLLEAIKNSSHNTDPNFDSYIGDLKSRLELQKDMKYFIDIQDALEDIRMETIKVSDTDDIYDLIRRKVGKPTLDKANILSQYYRHLKTPIAKPEE